MRWGALWFALIMACGGGGDGADAAVCATSSECAAGERCVNGACVVAGREDSGNPGADGGTDGGASGDGSVCEGTGCERCGEPCDTGNGCEVGVVDCSSGRPECVRARLRDSGYVCRPNAGACDVPESCDGSSPTCPPDEVAAADTECRPTAGPCDVAEVCDGSNPTCPPDEFRAEGECRPAVSECDVAESCDGTSAECPPDGFKPSTALCSNPLAPAYPCRTYRCAGDSPTCEHVGDSCLDGWRCCSFACDITCRER